MAAGDIDDGGCPPIRVLAVDDRPVNLLALSVVLEPLGIHIVTATSGPDALALAGSVPFAAILLDVRMEGMDGFETLERLRRAPTAEHTPVILLTAYELRADDMARVEGLGSVDYILKPIRPTLLRTKVTALISLHRQSEEIRLRGAALAAKDRDIAMLAHDLQGPLAAIALSADLLVRSALDGRAQSAALRIARVSRRMTEMVRNLTDHARAARGAIPITRKPTDLGDLCRELIEEFAFTAPGRQIDLACSGVLDGKWDRDRLYQALANLISNALRYGVRTVALRAQDAGPEVVVSVQNDGPPIAADLLPVIFRPFERGAHDRTGLGLGLYIVSEIVKSHQGQISVSSTAEAGTTFLLRLPRGARAELQAAAVPG